VVTLSLLTNSQITLFLSLKKGCANLSRKRKRGPMLMTHSSQQSSKVMLMLSTIQAYYQISRRWSLLTVLSRKVVRAAKKYCSQTKLRNVWAPIASPSIVVISNSSQMLHFNARRVKSLEPVINVRASSK